MTYFELLPGTVCINREEDDMIFLVLENDQRVMTYVWIGGRSKSLWKIIEWPLGESSHGRVEDSWFVIAAREVESAGQ